MKTLTVILLICSSSLFAQYYPHDESIDYREDFRGQYHFSPRSEWMNDINGLVYQGGKYHMIYQWGNKIRHGGYASSPDLLHWTDEGVALIPQNSFLPEEAIRNVSGEHVFSGSAVVVKGKTAKKITGSKDEAIVAIYTGTGAGTCLAWSNDVGKKWHDFIGNPVAHFTGEDRAYPRDPCVIWHKSSSRWILLLYENGTTFYGSDDLIKWEHLSNVDFGFECPDFFELPLDGQESNRKWVLQDANGSYLVGSFDGKTFLKDEKQDTLIMTLGLVTYKGEQRITRNPIKEISSLYTHSDSWEGQVIEKGTNLLWDSKSKTFDLTAEFDLTNTSATRIEFKVANKTIAYDISEETLLSEPCSPDDSNHITIRIMVDWGQLELFSNGGVYSYSEQFAFTPERGDIELITDGDVKLVSMELHELKRIW